MNKLIVAIAVLCMSASAYAGQCMIKVTSSSYVNAKHVAVVQKWDEETVVFRSMSNNNLVTVSFNDPRKVDPFIELMLARIELCL